METGKIAKPRLAGFRGLGLIVTLPHVAVQAVPALATQSQV